MLCLHVETSCAFLGFLSLLPYSHMRHKDICFLRVLNLYEDRDGFSVRLDSRMSYMDIYFLCVLTAGVFLDFLSRLLDNHTNYTNI